MKPKWYFLLTGNSCPTCFVDMWMLHFWLLKGFRTPSCVVPTKICIWCLSIWLAFQQTCGKWLHEEAHVEIIRLYYMMVPHNGADKFSLFSAAVFMTCALSNMTVVFSEVEIWVGFYRGGRFWHCVWGVNSEFNMETLALSAVSLTFSLWTACLAHPG